MKGSQTSGGGGGGSQGGTRVAHIAPQPHPLIDYVTQGGCCSRRPEASTHGEEADQWPGPGPASWLLGGCGSADLVPHKQAEPESRWDAQSEDKLVRTRDEARSGMAPAAGTWRAAHKAEGRTLPEAVQRHHLQKAFNKTEMRTSSCYADGIISLGRNG